MKLWYKNWWLSFTIFRCSNMKATTRLCPIVLLICAARLVCTAQQQRYNHNNGVAGYPLDYADAKLIQVNTHKRKLLIGHIFFFFKSPYVKCTHSQKYISFTWSLRVHTRCYVTICRWIVQISLHICYAHISQVYMWVLYVLHNDADRNVTVELRNIRL